jgi:hypothetical protein
MSDITSLNRSILELPRGEALALIAESRARRRKPTQKQKAEAKKKAIVNRPSSKRSPKQNADVAIGKLTDAQKLQLLKELGG